MVRVSEVLVAKYAGDENKLRTTVAITAGRRGQSHWQRLKAGALLKFERWLLQNRTQDAAS